MEDIKLIIEISREAYEIMKYNNSVNNPVCPLSQEAMVRKVAEGIPEQESKLNKALNLLAEWVVECDFGYDNIPEEYEKYKDDIAGMGYTEGLVYIAKKESEK